MSALMLLQLTKLSLHRCYSTRNLSRADIFMKHLICMMHALLILFMWSNMSSRHSTSLAVKTLTIVFLSLGLSSASKAGTCMTWGPVGVPPQVEVEASSGFYWMSGQVTCKSGKDCLTYLHAVKNHLPGWFLTTGPTLEMSIASETRWIMRTSFDPTFYADCHVNNTACDNVSQFWSATAAKCVPISKDTGEHSCESGAVYAGNPINVGTGNKVQIAPLISSNTIPLLNYTLTYNSTGIGGRHGAAWRGTFDQDSSSYPSAGNSWRIANSDGSTTSYAAVYSQSSDQYVVTPDPDFKGRIQLLSSGEHRVLDPSNKLLHYDMFGNLLQIIDHLGRTLTVNRTSMFNSTLDSVSDDFERRLLFEYTTDEFSLFKIKTLRSPAGDLYQFSYDGNENLQSIAWPDSTNRIYLYEDSRFPNHLTGIIDESNSRYATWSYDEQGRAISSAHADGANATLLTYNIGNTVVIDALQSSRITTFANIQNMARGTGSSQPGGSGCDQAASAQTYDTNGNIASRTDFNGNKTCYGYDSNRNLETRRVEGLASATVCSSALSSPPSPTTANPVRTISTEWHSYWRLPIKIAEPKKLSTYVYNGDNGNYCAPTTATVPSINGGTQPIGVVCSMTEQATSDTSGASGLNPAVIGQPRIWTYTYNEFGQVRTENGPRTDLSGIGDTTDYEYYAADDTDMGKRGNLKTVTNALGHQTHYTAYDLNGRVLSVSDPNGVITTFTYWPRGWLKSRTVAGKQTSYAYTPWGGLERITYPDYSYVHYTYDAAHRLTEISDATGRRVEYTLDLLGNRTKEEYRNADDSKAREVNRIFDALGRLKDEIQGIASNPARIYGYYAGGELKFETSPKAKTTNYEIDAHGRTTKKIDPLNSTAKPTLFQYDSLDQLSNLTAPNNAATGFTVDGLGNVKQEVSPDRGATNLDYDAAGNLITRTDARGRTETRTWDALNRPLTVSYSHGGGMLTYTWDSGCAYGKGRLCRINDPSGSTSFSYDERGNLVSEARTVGGITLPATQYAYNDADRLNTLITPSGKVVTLTPDAAGKTTRIETTINGTQTSLADAIQTDAAGQVTGLTLGNGTSQQWLYNLDGTLASGTDTPQMPWFASQGPAFDYAALVAATPSIAWQGAMHIVADDPDRDSDLDLFLYFNGGNEQYRDITCTYDCGDWYTGPDFGNLVYLERTAAGYVRRPFSNSDDIVSGDIEKMVALDYNNDGKTDLLLVTSAVSPAQYNPPPALLSGKPYRRLVLFKNDSGPTYVTAGNPSGTHFSDVTVATGLDKAVWYAEGLILDLDQDGYPDILGTSAGSNNIVLGDAFRYNPSTSTYQPYTTSGLPRPLWVGSLVDFNSDGRPDLVAQDAIGLRFFQNLGNGSFSEWTGTQNLSSLVGADWVSVIPADIDNDGLTDLATFETDYLGEYPNQSYAGGRMRWLRNAGISSGQITVVEQSFAAFDPPGNNEEVAYGGTVGDANNDGWLDLVLTDNKGSRLVAANGLGGFRRPEDAGEKVGLNAALGLFAQPVLLDVNSDGKADLLSSNASAWIANTGAATATRAGLSVELTGRTSGTGASGKDAWGARVEVTANGRTQTRQVLPIMGLSRRLHFGLGANPGNVDVRIFWPNSPTPQLISGTPSVNSILRVTQP